MRAAGRALVCSLGNTLSWGRGGIEMKKKNIPNSGTLRLYEKMLVVGRKKTRERKRDHSRVVSLFDNAR